MRFFISGGAPLARDIAEFFWAAGITILEGYGLTETSPVIGVNRPERIKFGTIGPLIPGVEVKIADDGEVLTRGPHVMKGYYRDEAATREAIDEEGWFRTGDVGFVDSEGYLAITDRKKDLIVTAGGKNIAPQPIENRLKANPFIAEAVVVGNRRSFPAALVVPDFAKLAEWAGSEGVDLGDEEATVNNPQVVALMENQIEEATKDMASFEKVKKIRLIPREFTIEKGELTPTLKVKRSVVEERFKDLIDQMYV
jgi:long-chain acyl-CoA synthetase